MSLFNFFRINILLLAIISITFVLPIGVAAYHQEFQVIPSFFIPGIVCIGGALIFLQRHSSLIYSNAAKPSGSSSEDNSP